MLAKSINLSWIVVKNFKQAVQFYTDVIGLKVVEIYEDYGWAELQGEEGGCRLGISQIQPESFMEPGQNACITLKVENLEQAKALMAKKGAKILGETQVIPGHVKLQMIVDQDGNHMQLAEMIP